MIFTCFGTAFNQFSIYSLAYVSNNFRVFLLIANSYTVRYASKIRIYNANALSLWPCIVNSWNFLNPKPTCSTHKALSVCIGYVTDSKSMVCAQTLYTFVNSKYVYRVFRQSGHVISWSKGTIMTSVWCATIRNRQVLFYWPFEDWCA